MPPVEILSKFDDSLAVQSNELAQKWLASAEPEAKASDIEGWSTPQTGTTPHTLRILTHGTHKPQTLNGFEFVLRQSRSWRSSQSRRA